MKRRQVNKKIKAGGVTLDGEFRLRIVDGAVTITADPDKVTLDYWDANAKQTTK